MNAKDVMTTPVVTVTPDTTVREIAALLLERRISAVPVVADGRLVGLVSEGDLLRRHEIGTDRKRPARSWWLALIDGPGASAEYVKSHGAHARDIMTRDPITVAKENFYDRLPFTYRQVDIFCKVLIGVLIAIFVYYAVLK